MTSPQRWFLVLFVCVAACADDVEGGALPDAQPGALPFLAACNDNAECASGLCFNFNAKGNHCTHGCQSAADCEAPSPGCSGMNVCKAP